MSASKKNGLPKLIEMMRFVSNIAFTDENNQRHTIAAWNRRAGGGGD